MPKPTSDVHDEIRRRVHQLDGKRSKDHDTLLRYYVGAEKAFEQAGRALLRALG
jgi:hypothetical protein